MRHDNTIYLPRNQINFDPDFRFRDRDTAEIPSHVDDLARALRSNGQLDPITVWEEQDEVGTTTGRFVLLDGYFRLQAYRKARRSKSGIPCRIFTGTRREAEITAFASNSKAVRALSKRECVNAAWVLSWRHGTATSKRDLARAAGVSQRTIANMRSQMRKIRAEGAEEEAFTGNWQRDKFWPKGSPWEAPSDAEREKAIEETAKALTEVFRMNRPRDAEVEAEALQKALGDHDLRHIFDYLYATEDDLEADEDVGIPMLDRPAPIRPPVDPEADF
ncbi:ParB/RepB/Spo0J family partition protein [Pseudooceanicola nitratireducens]|uniref:ParB/RepB/Spo0J family partition protein n=1 Tax=Pseudooceanicola nitratireducens TaxID=517719 RepID=UPI0035117965